MRNSRLFLCIVSTTLMVSAANAGLKDTLFATQPDTTSLRVNVPQPAPRWTNDAWFGQDKVNHLLICMMLSSSAYLGLAATGNNRDQTLAGAIGGTMVIGVGKEVWDVFHPGTPSWKDLTADAVGALLGSLTARAIY